MVGSTILATHNARLFVDAETGESPGTRAGVFRLLRIPSIMLMVFAVTATGISLTFIDPTLEPHLKSVGVVYHLS